eukprot:1140381-Pelagomonas_calceolata.AAC.5
MMCRVALLFLFGPLEPREPLIFFHFGVCCCSDKAREEAQELRGKTFRWRLDRAVYPTLLGSVKCDMEDINALWSEHPSTFAVCAVDACHL